MARRGRPRVAWWVALAAWASVEHRIRKGSSRLQAEKSVGEKIFRSRGAVENRYRQGREIWKEGPDALRKKAMDDFLSNYRL